MSRAAAQRTPVGFKTSVLPSAKPARFPGFVERCDPTLREKAPADGRPVHEIKFDGYRTQAHLRNGRLPSTHGARTAQLGKTSDHAPAWIELKDIAPIRFRKNARA
jgi:hypothetical protein